MAKIVTIHQPNYLPWIGLFSKVCLADCLLIYDNAQYIKSSVINRNSIRTPVGSNYLTVPVGRYPTCTKISEVILPDKHSWRNEHWQAIYQNYVKTPFFTLYKDFFEELYQTDFKYLWEINEKIILYLLKCFDIKVEIIKTSTLAVDPGLCKTDLMIAYLKSAGSNVYISGPSGKNYLEVEKFSQNNIELKFFQFQHPIYKQRFTGFESNMSAIDLLFNKGPEASIIIKTAGSLEESTLLSRV